MGIDQRLGPEYRDPHKEGRTLNPWTLPGPMLVDIDSEISVVP